MLPFFLNSLSLSTQRLLRQKLFTFKYLPMKSLFIIMTALLVCSVALVICAVIQNEMTTAIAALYLCLASAVGAAISAGILDEKR